MYHSVYQFIHHHLTIIMKNKNKKLLQNHVPVYVCVYAHQTTFQSFHHHNYIEIMIFCFSQTYTLYRDSLSGCHIHISEIYIASKANITFYSQVRRLFSQSPNHSQSKMFEKYYTRREKEPQALTHNKQSIQFFD